MNKIEVFTYRGRGLSENMFLEIDEQRILIPFEKDDASSYNNRVIFEYVEEFASYHDSILGEKKISLELGDVRINASSDIRLKYEIDIFSEAIKNVFEDGVYYVTCDIFLDRPVNQYDVLKALPIPTDILTFYIKISKSETVAASADNKIQKYFDGFSHLGFLLVDLEKMKEIIFLEHGDKELDLVNEFTNSDLVDKLFAEGILIVIWGINPYTYPIYSARSEEILKPLLGEAYDFEGIYKIKKDIKTLSLVPGHKLRQWPKFLNEHFPEIQLFGSGEKLTLKPYALKDKDSEITIASFLIVRSEGNVDESKPIMNVNLLY